ncbi:aminodeoxychorismate synthase component I [Sphingorhabdus sp. 109]|jgi:para-aminobenzoate synthetase/4-amino-4-deoxychorismate lyase|uniref:aminodeoxychorismate synthase component I n=1 Tax=Sphingorhabdus sp. 109 TaxID=2653173 RepID=UPI0012F3FB44|nr:aminodeoxychorismate synthase component I [Sphingorhabdus sp. 109]VWX59185.1 Aminodeoxychorismate synthase, component I [Sphingorhabdus sp. 109]
MFDGNSPFVLLDDARACDAAPARLYSDPVAVIRADKMEELEACFAALSRARSAGQHVAGYLSYEAGLGLEARLRGKMPADLPAPLAWFGIFQDYKEITQKSVGESLPDRNGAWLGRLKPSISRDAYEAAFKKVQNYINNGDIYQANLTFRAEMDFSGHPLALYAAIRDRAQAGYGGVVFDGDNWMLSFSPELFFALKDGRITAKPMKGTAARVADPTADAAVQDHLQSDPKQRAENLMIVDLLRNDLSRVAQRGSVAVPELFHIESYPTIHQMTSTVTAQLQDGLDAVDIIRQIFPCGSITGAPKIRAMEIIDELESAPQGSPADHAPRGIYCGSIGRIDAPDAQGRSDAAFNVAIRTFFLQEGKETLSIGLGSGIVADSDGEDEWRECLAKGRFAKVDANAEGGHKVDLIETMAFDPASGIARLEAHLERMKTSAATQDFEFDRHAARNAIQAITFHQDSPAMVRLHLGQSGALAIELKPMPAPPDGPVPCRLVPMQADKADFRLHHKTSDRRVYAVDGLADGVHPIFVDGEGYVTEGAIWNIFVERDGKLLTPPLGRGLLSGVLRAELLESGQAVETDLTAADLAGGFLVGNSVRGLVAGVVAG